MRSAAPLLLLTALAAQAPTPAERVIAVVDAQGRPVAGVPVRLGHDQGWPFGFQALPTAAVVRTDAQGLARLPAAADPALVAEAQVLAEPPVRAGFGSADGRAVLRLPPCGLVRVLCYGADERPLAGVAKVELALAGNRRFFDPVPADGQPEAEGAHFRHVQVGQSLTARATLAGVIGTLAATAPGPTRPGELVVIDLRLQAANLLSLRLVDAAGNPAANAPLGVVRIADQTATELDLDTDAAGRLRWLLPPGTAGMPNASLRLCRRGTGPTTEYLGAATVSLAVAWQGERDLGDVRLHDEPEFASGRLVDPEGKPLAGVLLEASPTATLNLVGHHVDGTRATHRVRTDADGRFVFHELEPSTGHLVVGAEPGVFLTPPATVAAGNGTTLVAGRPATATVVLPGLSPAVVTHAIRLRRREQGNLGMDFGSAGRCESTAAGFTFRGLQPGTYDLLLDSEIGGRPAASIDGIELRSGAAADDPRLVVAGWRDHLVEVDWQVAGPEPLREGVQVLAVAVGPSGYTMHGHGHLREAPKHLLLGKRQHLLFQGPRIRTVVVDVPAPGTKVTLQPRPTVQLRLAAKVTLPAGWQLRLHDPARPWLDAATLLLLDGGTAWTLAPAYLGPLAATLSAPDGKGGYTELWHAALMVPEAERSELELPLDAATATALREAATTAR